MWFFAGFVVGALGALVFVYRKEIRQKVSKLLDKVDSLD